MTNKSENIDRYFNTRLGELEQKPPESSWNAIASKLGHNKNKGMAFLIFRIAAGMAILISTGIGFYLLTKPVSQNKAPVISASKLDVASKDTIITKRSLKAYPVATHKKKSSISDRIEPVRKVYEGPVRSEISAADIDTVSNINKITGKTIHHSRQNQSLILTEIESRSHRFLLPVDLPLTLSHTHRLPAAAFATNETKEDIPILASDEAVETNEIKQQKHWALGGEMAPLYSYRNIASNNLTADQVDDMNETETGLLAYAGGIRVAYATGKRLSVQSGIYYSRYGQEKNEAKSFNSDNIAYLSCENNSNPNIAITNSTGVISSDNPKKAGFNNVISSSMGTLHSYSIRNGLIEADYSAVSSSEEIDVTFTQLFDYLEVPLIVKYKIIDRKVDFSFSGGLVTNFLIGNKVNIIKDGEKNLFGETTAINNVNYQGSFGLALEYPLVPGFAFSIEPRLRYYINPIDKSTNVHPYSFGLFAGLNYVF